MKNLFFILLLTVVFSSCNDNPINENRNNPTIDESILGTWKVVYSTTIDSVMLAANDSLIYIGDTIIYSEYFGGSGEKINSHMFGQQENIIQIRDDNKIKIYFINSRGGITITNDYIPYYINNRLLIYNDSKNSLFHSYYFKEDTLIIQRIPEERISWRYKLSKYIRIDDI